MAAADKCHAYDRVAAGKGNADADFSVICESKGFMHMTAAVNVMPISRYSSAFGFTVTESGSLKVRLWRRGSKRQWRLFRTDRNGV